MYCTNCGSQNTDGVLYCTNCGARLEGDSQQTPPVQTAPSPSAQPQVQPQIQPAVQPSGQFYAGVPVQQRPADLPKKSYTPVVVAAIAAIAVVAVVAILAFSGALGNKDDASNDVYNPNNVTNTSNASSGNASSSSSTASASSGSASTASSSANSDADIQSYQNLTRYYDALADYDSRIAACATDFNNNYALESYSDRRAYLSTAQTLSNELASSISSLSATSVSSNYAGTKSEIQTCYSDCKNRIDVIIEAWNISLKYSVPKNHKDAIIAPIKRDNDGQNNRYYTDFNNRYPNCCPTI